MALVPAAVTEDNLSSSLQTFELAERKARDEGEKTALKLKSFMQALQGELDGLTEKNRLLHDQLDASDKKEREMEVLYLSELAEAKASADAAKNEAQTTEQEADAAILRAPERVAAAITARSEAVLAAKRTVDVNVAALQRELEEMHRDRDAARIEAVRRQERVVTERSSQMRSLAWPKKILSPILTRPCN